MLLMLGVEGIGFRSVPLCCGVDEVAMVGSCERVVSDAKPGGIGTGLEGAMIWTGRCDEDDDPNMPLIGLVQREPLLAYTRYSISR